MNRDLRDRFVNWRDGQIVSCVIGGKTLTGVAKVVTRKLDGRKYYRVKFTTRDRMGDTDWASLLPWVIGLGRYETRCADCGGDFRSNDVKECLCPTCEGATVHDGTAQPYTNLGGPGPRRRRA